MTLPYREIRDGKGRLVLVEAQSRMKDYRRALEIELGRSLSGRQWVIYRKRLARLSTPDVDNPSPKVVP